jgi:DNA (cytosine-5)-methyltransferase 1
MRVLDLFSGIGGFSLGLERAGMTTVAFCEQDKFCQQVLAKHWPDVPCYPDIKELTGDQIEREIGPIDVVCGGYPCQPFSVAGERRGEEDDRHLWPEMYRIVASVRPTWVIAENVAGHITMGLDEVLSDLEAEGYAVWPLVIPAVAVDARHRRDRLWIVANAKRERGPGGKLHDRDELQAQAGGEANPLGTGSSGQTPVADTGRNTTRGNPELDGDTPQRPQGIVQPGNGGEDVADAKVEGLEGHGRSEEAGSVGGKGRNPATSGGASGPVPDADHDDLIDVRGEQLEGQEYPKSCDGGKVVADTQSNSTGGRPKRTATTYPRPSRGSQDVADPKRERQPRQGEHEQPVNPAASADREAVGAFDGGGPQFWPTEPNVGRVANGVPRRVDRLKSLGNAVVPQVPEVIGRAIMESELCA